MKNLLTVLTISAIVNFSCKKDSNNQYCWQILDAIGNRLNTVCNKTESEMQSVYPSPCLYYKIGDNYCWFLGNATFLKNVPEDFAIRYIYCHNNYTTYQKVACDYCQNWYSRQKKLYKPNNTFIYSSIYLQLYCGDTVRTLFQGREIILRETADSLITLQFSNNVIF